MYLTMQVREVEVVVVVDMFAASDLRNEIHTPDAEVSWGSKLD